MSSACSWQEGQAKSWQTFEQKYACKFPCAYILAKKKHYLINQKPLHYLSSALLQPYDPIESIHVKSSSFSKSTNFSGNQPSGKRRCRTQGALEEVCTGGACAHRRGQSCTPMPTVCSSCFTSLVHADGWNTKHPLENPKDSSVSYQDVQKTTSWADYQ